LFTLRVAALVGEQFCTEMLIESGICPLTFKYSALNQASIFKILDILEENDFIEMIHEQKGNRFYRFNHDFLKDAISLMIPF